ncbi:MAG: hypothetical protein HYV93_20515 [Candidatus Rokubacteria bacterium]|nr:hypothetical protein [Candidatus Rokubacteria bacterium]
MKRLSRMVSLVAAVLAVVAPLAGAEEITRHSGTVLAVDPSAGTLVLGEVGPWRLERGETRITRLAIATSPTTEFSLAERVADGSGGFPGAFAERLLDRGRVKVGDFVTVSGRRQGKRLAALKVTVSTLDGP